MEIEPPPPKLPKLSVDGEEQDIAIKALEKCLEDHDNNRKDIQDKLHKFCEEFKIKIEELEDRITKELDEKFALADAKLQEASNELRANSTINALQKARAELIAIQSYDVVRHDSGKQKSSFDLVSLYELKTEKRFIPDLIEMRKPTNVCVTNVCGGRIFVEFTCLGADEERALSDYATVRYKCMLFKENEQNSKEYTLYKDKGNSFFASMPNILESNTIYAIRVKVMVGDKGSTWSDEIAFLTPEFSECVAWKECPDDVDWENKYIVDKKNPRIATNANGNNWCTIIGGIPIPLNVATSWGIKILESKDNNGKHVLTGVTPSDINQNVHNLGRYGWYFYCYDSTLYSGPPHNYIAKEYGPRKRPGQYVHDGDSIGSVIDTTKGELSFVLNGMNLGVAYKGIPLDKPLVPCVLLGYNDASIELVAKNIVSKNENIMLTSALPSSMLNNEDEQNSAKFAEERENVLELLEKRLEAHDDNRRAVQEGTHDFCINLMGQVDELEERITKKLEKEYVIEDNRLQTSLSELRESKTASALQKAKEEFLVNQTYEIIENKLEVVEKQTLKLDLTTLCELKTERGINPELVKLRKPTNVRVAYSNGRASVRFIFLTPNEKKVFSKYNVMSIIKYRCVLFKKGNEQESKEYYLVKSKNDEDDSSSFTFTPNFLEPKKPYSVKVKVTLGDNESEWSESAEFTSEFKECWVWKECPDDVDERLKYSVDEKNPRIATKIKRDLFKNLRCTIIGNAYIPLNTVTSWSIKVPISMFNNEGEIFIGVAPSDINQNKGDNHGECGWYFNYGYSSLYSGPPHKYRYKEYGPRKGPGQYVRTGDSVGVVMDTTKGELSFILNGVNFGVAYERIPLDKPIVPCVLLGSSGSDFIELDTSKTKENVDSSIPVPSNVVTKSITWDSITLTWDEVSGASFYQIEVDRSISCYIARTNSFVKRGLLPNTEHSFRVRTVRGSSVGEWSGVVKGRTLKTPEFSKCVWKKCPDDVGKWNKYSVDDKNPRVATKINSSGRYDNCTIIGNTYIPLNAVASWSIKILNSWGNNGDRIYIGVAPSDINQNENNVENCGWYFYCYKSVLHSGPPHNYIDKVYGPRKWDGDYVHTGDNVGVVVDTTRGDLSFVLNGVNRGAAYKGIPLDKPLVPCVLLKYFMDSVELVAKNEVKDRPCVIT